MTTKSYAEYAVNSGLAIVTLDNPPVNALSPTVIQELYEAIQRAQADKNLNGIIITGNGGKFSGGFDITKLGNPGDKSKKNLLDAIDAIENSSKPVIAVIDGIAFGGGLEVALACDYRIATAGSSVAFPEIKLGIFPGAQGTQRLPRVVGIGPALDIILSGEPIEALKAKELGIIDEILDVNDGNFVESVISFAKRAVEKHGLKKVSKQKVTPNPDAVAQARRRAAPVEMGGLASHKAIEAIEATGTKSFAEGCALEEKLFVEAVESEQAKAKIHLFFAERAVGKIPELSGAKAVVESKEIRSVAVLGAGTMGHGITINFANARIPVTIIDTTSELVNKGLSSIQRNYQLAVRKNRISQAEHDKRLGLIHTATDFKGLADVDLVIEAVFEDMDVKKEVFKKLNEVVRPDTILATNTSTLDIDEIASVVAHPERVLGMHFFSPANVMKLLEIVRGKDTSSEVIAAAMQIAKKIKKIGVVVGNCYGFVGNRMLAGYLREAELLLEEGAKPEQVDKAIQKFGFAMGPFAVSDLAGLDIGYKARKEREKKGPLPYRFSDIRTRLVEMGRLGQKNGAGYYKYQENSYNATPDPQVEQIIATEAKKHGIERKPVTDDAIVKRLVYALINEGAKIVEERIASRASDIDVIWVYGYGFPAFRGGPMHYADTIGLQKVLEEIKLLQKQDPEFWTPAPLLEQLAQTNKSFAEYRKRA